MGIRKKRKENILYVLFGWREIECKKIIFLGVWYIYLKMTIPDSVDRKYPFLQNPPPDKQNTSNLSSNSNNNPKSDGNSNNKPKSDAQKQADLENQILARQEAERLARQAAERQTNDEIIDNADHSSEADRQRMEAYGYYGGRKKRTRKTRKSRRNKKNNKRKITNKRRRRC